MKVQCVVLCFAVLCAVALGGKIRRDAPKIEEQFQNAKEALSKVAESIINLRNSTTSEDFVQTMKDVTSKATENFRQMSEKIQDEISKSMNEETKTQMKNLKARLDEEWGKVTNDLTKVTPAASEAANNLQNELVTTFKKVVEMAEKTAGEISPNMESATNVLKDIASNLITESTNALNTLTAKTKEINKAAGN